MSEPVIYLLWGQYGDKSGETFIGAYESEKTAKDTAALIDLTNPAMNIRVTAVTWRPEQR